MWRGGESTLLPPKWPGLQIPVSTPYVVEFVVRSLPCSEKFFSGFSGFPCPQKPTFPKFQFDQQSGGRRTTEWICYLQIFIYFTRSFIYWISPCLLVHLIVFPFLSSPGTEEGKIHKCSKTYSSQFLETYDVGVIAYCFVVMSRLFNCSLWCLFTLVFLFSLVCCSKSSTRPIGSASCRGCLAVIVVLPT